jgi:hypothetical protein
MSRKKYIPSNASILKAFSGEESVEELWKNSG